MAWINNSIHTNYWVTMLILDSIQTDTKKRQHFVQAILISLMLISQKAIKPYHKYQIFIRSGGHSHYAPQKGTQNWNFSSLKVCIIHSYYIVKWINTLRPRQNGHHFLDDIFKCIFLNENVSISIMISLKFVPRGQINNIPALVQIMAWRLHSAKPLSEPMMVSLLTWYWKTS